jgi:hypothetical protein
LDDRFDDCLAVVDGQQPLIDRLDVEVHEHARADLRVKVLMGLPGVRGINRAGHPR